MQGIFNVFIHPDLLLLPSSPPSHPFPPKSEMSSFLFLSMLSPGCVTQCILGKWSTLECGQPTRGHTLIFQNWICGNRILEYRTNS